MAYKIADNILSPLGATTAANYRAVCAGQTALRHYDGMGLCRQPFVAALFPDRASTLAGYTFFESLVLASLRDALSQTTLDLSRDRVVLILSTTKGNVELLATAQEETLSLSASAQRIATAIGLTTTPLVVCNACISGLHALIVAQRLLAQGLYDYALVAGADVVCPFVVAGFAALQVLSSDECRPFDNERRGLNLGEAAATIILSRRCPDTAGTPWVIGRGAIHNDAYHISTPSKKGEGLYRAITAVLSSDDYAALALVNAHGTGTLFNDQMEAVALARAGLAAVPTTALKGYYGHTMGAAGLVETILTMRALDDGIILPTRGFSERGVSREITVSAAAQRTDKRAFLKILSGFGGTNAAVVVRQSRDDDAALPVPVRSARHTVHILPSSVVVDGVPLSLSAEGPSLLTEIYKQYVDDYPKYYKMDPLCRLGFVASELLWHVAGVPCDENTAVVFGNHSSSTVTDRNFLATLGDKDNYYPSPSLFVYTLPNIVSGEVAIRRHCLGETAFYILPQKDTVLLAMLLGTVPVSSLLVAGWVDYADDRHFEAEIALYDNNNQQ